MSVMLYKKGGKVKLHGLMCSHTIVEEDAVEAALKEGWAKSPAEAHAEPKTAKTSRKSTKKAG